MSDGYSLIGTVGDKKKLTQRSVVQSQFNRRSMFTNRNQTTFGQQYDRSTMRSTPSILRCIVATYIDCSTMQRNVYNQCSQLFKLQHIHQISFSGRNDATNDASGILYLAIVSRACVCPCAILHHQKEKRPAHAKLLLIDSCNPSVIKHLPKPARCIITSIKIVTFEFILFVKRQIVQLATV